MNTTPYWNTGSFNSYDPFSQMNGMGAQFNAFTPMNQQFNGQFNAFAPLNQQFNQQFSTPFNGYNTGGYNDMWGPLRDLSYQSQMGTGTGTSFPGVPSNLPAVPTTLPYLDPSQWELYQRTGQLPTGPSTTPTTPTAPTAEMTAARTLILANSGGKLVDAQLSQMARTMDANGDGLQELVFQYGSGGSALKFIPGSSRGTDKDFEELFAQAMAATTKSASKTVSGALSTLEIVGSGTDAATNKTYYVIKITNAPLTTPAT